MILQTTDILAVLETLVVKEDSNFLIENIQLTENCWEPYSGMDRTLKEAQSRQAS